MYAATNIHFNLGDNQVIDGDRQCGKPTKRQIYQPEVCPLPPSSHGIHYSAKMEKRENANGILSRHNKL
jgi:hypothetical protein